MDLRASLHALSPSAFCAAHLSFREITTEDDLIDAVLLALPPEQQALVNPLSFSLGRAYLFPADFIPYLIIHTESNTPIGFIQLCRFLGTEEDALSWSYYIIPAYQHKGYGTEAATLAVSVLRCAVPDVPICLSVEQDNYRAQALYQSIGFTRTSRMDGDDIVYEYSAEGKQQTLR